MELLVHDHTVIQNIVHYIVQDLGRIVDRVEILLHQELVVLKNDLEYVAAVGDQVQRGLEFVAERTQDHIDYHVFLFPGLLVKNVGQVLERYYVLVFVLVADTGYVYVEDLFFEFADIRRFQELSLLCFGVRVHVQFEQIVFFLVLLSLRILDML